MAKSVVVLVITRRRSKKVTRLFVTTFGALVLYYDSDGYKNQTGYCSPNGEWNWNIRLETRTRFAGFTPSPSVQMLTPLPSLFRQQQNLKSTCPTNLSTQQRVLISLHIHFVIFWFDLCNISGRTQHTRNSSLHLDLSDLCTLFLNF